MVSNLGSDRVVAFPKDQIVVSEVITVAGISFYPDISTTQSTLTSVVLKNCQPPTETLRQRLSNDRGWCHAIAINATCKSYKSSIQRVSVYKSDPSWRDSRRVNVEQVIYWIDRLISLPQSGKILFEPPSYAFARLSLLKSFLHATQKDSCKSAQPTTNQTYQKRVPCRTWRKNKSEVYDTDSSSFKSDENKI